MPVIEVIFPDACSAPYSVIRAKTPSRSSGTGSVPSPSASTSRSNESESGNM